MILKNPSRENDFTNITEVGDNLYWGDIEIKKVNEEDKKISKTNANYVMHINNGATIYCHLNEKNGTFWIAETVNKDQHTVWIGNQAVAYYPGNIILREFDAKTNKDEFIPFQNEASMKDLIDSKYKEYNSFKEEDLVADNNYIKQHTPKEEVRVENKDSVVSDIKPIPEKVGYLKGLGEEIRHASKENMGLGAALGIKDLYQASLKKNKFLTLGTTAALIGLGIVSAPTALAVGIVVSTVVAGGAALEGSIVAAVYTTDYVGDKIKKLVGHKDKEENIALENEVSPKSPDEVKGVISNMRKNSINNMQSKNKNQI